MCPGRVSVVAVRALAATDHVGFGREELKREVIGIGGESRDFVRNLLHVACTRSLSASQRKC